MPGECQAECPEKTRLLLSTKTPSFRGPASAEWQLFSELFDSAWKRARRMNGRRRRRMPPLSHVHEEIQGQLVARSVRPLTMRPKPFRRGSKPQTCPDGEALPPPAEAAWTARRIPKDDHPRGQDHPCNLLQSAAAVRELCGIERRVECLAITFAHQVEPPDYSEQTPGERLRHGREGHW